MSKKPFSLWGDPVSVIREAGVWNLGTYGPCDCAHFVIQTITVHVSCHKSGRDIEVSADSVGPNRAMLEAVAAEVLRQLGERTSPEWAATFAVNVA